MFFPYKFKNNRKIKSLQVQNPRLVKERMSLSTLFYNKVGASIVVEAALVMPLFLFTLIGLLYFLVVMSIQTRLNSALIEVGRETAKYSFTYDQIMELSSEEEGKFKESIESGLDDLLKNGFSTIYASERIKEMVGREWLTSTYIKGGSNGIYFIGSDFLDKNDVIDLILRYQIELPFFLGEWNQMTLIQRCRIKAWTGFYMDKKEEETEALEDLVYITETGSVYHDNPNCTHLNLSIQSVAFNKIEILRNESGGKYHSCEICVKEGIKRDVIYITNTGIRYHYNLTCSGLKRGVTAIPLSEVSDRKLCKRCGERKGGD